MLEVYYKKPNVKTKITKTDEYIIDEDENELVLYTYYNYIGFHKINPNKYKKMYLPISSYEKLKKLIKLDYEINIDNNFVILTLKENIDINSYLDLKKTFEVISITKNKPKLLIHSCCGPCSSHILDLLNEYYDITIFYQNSNIDTYEEYKYRLKTQRKIASIINDQIEVIDDIYDNSIYDKYTIDYYDKGEKSIRCYKCYEFRLEMCAKYAKEHNYDYFTTTLSISPYKVEKWINEIGKNLENKYGIKFMFSNFKQENGYIHSIELSKTYDLYRQDYCGCKYSKIEKNAKS